MTAEEDHVLKTTMTMEEVRILDICRDIELLNEQLYRYFADLFQENEEIATLWRKTANEEANHAQLFELAIRIKKRAAGIRQNRRLDDRHSIQVCPYSSGECKKESAQCG